MQLSSFIKATVNMASDDLDKLDALFTTQHYSKSEIILTPDNQSTKLVFVEKGLIRMFYQKEDKDITFLFRDENSFTAPIESIFYNRPAPYGWEAIEDTTVRSIKYRDFDEQFAKLPGLEKLARIVLIDSFRTVSQKLFGIQFQTAEQRYSFMIKAYPNILLRAPLGHIASYLGITQQTLSVIRGKKLL